MKKLSLLVPLLIFLTIGCVSEQQQIQLDTDQLIEDLRFISSDETEGRRTGTEGNRIAREYLVERFEEAGAEPFRGSFTHEFEFENRDGEEMTGINVIGQVTGNLIL